MTKIPSDDILEKLVQIKNTRVRETQDRIGIVRPGDSSEEKQDLIITDWRRWWKDVSSNIYETEILGLESEIMKETQW